MGLFGDLLVGIVGALIGSWLLPRLGMQPGAGFVTSFVNETVGAIVLMLVITLVLPRRAGRGATWGGRW